MSAGTEMLHTAPTGPEATIEALLAVLPYFQISRGKATEMLRRNYSIQPRMDTNPAKRD